MLYDRWRQIARECRDQIAVVDAASGEKWTFGALDAAAERGGPQDGSIAFPQGITPQFILGVLRAWRTGAVVCPLEDGQTAHPFAKLPPGCAHLKTTSASTGVPRVIAFSPDQLRADVAHIVATMGLRRDWPNLGVVSLAHSYGFSNLVLPLLLEGIPLILVPSPLPETLRRAAALAPAITLPAVPALWRTWFDSRAIPDNVRLAISAGAPLPLGLEQQVFEQHHLKIHNFYGASECGGIAYDASASPRQDASCVGPPVQGVQVSIGADGCLCVRGPAVGSTYWPEPSDQLEHGCYRSSDLAEISDGQVFLRGRQSDQINVAGRKVSPENIERVLASHPAVRACLVFGAPSPDHRTEMIVACVAARFAVGPEVLKQHLLASLPAWQLPRDWWFVPTLEVNPRGKLGRNEWRKRYLAR